jgi:hypothetical protein
MVNSTNFIADILSFIKTDLSSNVTDPLVSTRVANSRWVATSYPQSNVIYPLITIKLTNQKATRAGLQTEAMDVEITLEIRVWARNEKEKDDLSNKVYKRLRDIQFTTTGSENANLHDFNLLSAVEIDEPGEGNPKSRVLQVRYKFYDI